jgi:hypothetical protein
MQTSAPSRYATTVLYVQCVSRDITLDERLRNQSTHAVQQALVEFDIPRSNTCTDPPSVSCNVQGSLSNQPAKEAYRPNLQGSVSIGWRPRSSLIQLLLYYFVDCPVDIPGHMWCSLVTGVCLATHNIGSMALSVCQFVP